jgi:hypothetical protein
MSKRKADADYWAAIDLLYPKHRFSGGWGSFFKDQKYHCTDAEPSGWGNYGCKSCDAIVRLEKRGRKIWPRVGR